MRTCLLKAEIVKDRPDYGPGYIEVHLENTYPKVNLLISPDEIIPDGYYTEELTRARSAYHTARAQIEQLQNSHCGCTTHATAISNKIIPAGCEQDSKRADAADAISNTDDNEEAIFAEAHAWAREHASEYLETINGKGNKKQND